MNQTQIINELKTIRAHAAELSERSYRLLRKLEGVSTPSLRKGSGLDEAQKAALIAKRRKTALK